LQFSLLLLMANL